MPLVWVVGVLVLAFAVVVVVQTQSAGDEDTIVSIMTDEQEPIGAEMAALTDVLPSPNRSLPLLILDQRPEMAVRSGPADRVNLFVSPLLSTGLTLVTTISEAGPGTPDVIEVGEPLAPAPGWRLELSARRAARLTAPDGSIIWGGECGQPRPWRALITRTSRCALLIGAIGLYPTSERVPTRITTLLDQAAHAGELVGGLVEARSG